MIGSPRGRLALLLVDLAAISAGLGWACVESTGFIGSDKVAVLRANGTEQKLVPFVIEGNGDRKSVV